MTDDLQCDVCGKSNSWCGWSQEDDGVRCINCVGVPRPLALKNAEEARRRMGAYFDFTRTCAECGCAPFRWDEDGRFAHDVTCNLGRLTYEALKAQEEDR
jgi:hypothetical protein